jgi:hypothetical protein
MRIPHGPAPSNPMWDRRVDRILHSRNALERRHLYLGHARGFGYPVYLDRRLLNLHGWVHGGSGSRKTSLSYASLITQLVAGESRRRLDWLASQSLDSGERSSIVVLDLKGDLSLLWNCYLEARSAGLPFKVFTNVVGRTSHAFNPLSPEHLAALTTTNQKCQTVLQALSAEYGPGYGQSFFSAMNEIVMLNYLQTFGRINSFAELHALLSSPELYPGAKADWAKAQHLPALAGRLGGVYPLNLLPADLPGRPDVFAEQIRLPDVLRQSQVVYFYLQTAIEKATVSAVAKLALYMLFCAAAARGPADQHRVYVFIDEFQQVIGANVALLLEQARSMKLSLVLAHQNLGQLKADRSADLADAVESCVGFEQAFKLSGEREFQRVMALSGMKRDWGVSWKQDGGVLHPDAATDGYVVSESRVPRLGLNELLDITAAPFESLVRFSEGSGYTQFGGHWVPLVGEFHIGADEYAAREAAGWPADLGPGTVEVGGDDAVRRLAERASRGLDAARLEAALGG